MEKPATGRREPVKTAAGEQGKSDKSHRSLIESAGLIGFFTLMSRVAGMARDIVSARMFGTGRVWDAFLYAFTIPNFLRRLVGEGALSNAFIPVYIQVLKEKGREEADKVGNIVSTLLTLFLGAVIALVLLATQAALSWFHFPEKVRLTLEFLQIIFPYIFFVAHVAISMGILNCHKHFFTPSLSPVILNFIWLGAILFVCPFGTSLEARAKLLSACLLFSGFIQLGIQFFPLRGLGYRTRLCFEFFHPAIQKIFRLILPAIMGFAVTQVNILLDMTMAFMCGDGANAALWYGNRLMQFPLGLFGIAMGTALLPEFAGHAAENKLDEMRETLSFSLRATSFIVIPASFGLMFLKTPIVRVLFERGNFDAVSTLRTANVVFCYSIGLFAYSGQKMMSSAFYAVQDTKTPFVLSCYAVVLNFFLNLMLMIPFKESGLALSTSISGILNFALQIFIFQKRIKKMGMMRILVSFAKIGLASLIMGLASLWLINHVHFPFHSQMLAGIAELSFAIVMGILIYLGVSYILRIEELRSLVYLLTH